MKASGCVGDAFQGMTFRLQRCPVHHHGQYLLLHNSTPKSLQRCSQNKGCISASMWILGIQSLLCGYSQDLGGKLLPCISIQEFICFDCSAWSSSLSLLSWCGMQHQSCCYMQTEGCSCCVRSFEIFIQLPYQNVTHGNFLPSTAPPPDFIPSISCIDTDQHIPNIRGITYCPCDTLQMHLRLMIYRGRGSTKTISKPDTLTSDFKKFPSNLFDLWKCVQVHREWFQIYHILVRIINDFQFVNLRLPCSEELRRITKGGYQSPCFAPEAWLLYQNIATYDLHFTYFPLLQSLSRCLHFSPLSATHIFQKRLPNTRAATAYVIAWLIFWS